MAENSAEKCSDASTLELSIDLEEALPIETDKLNLFIENYVGRQLSKQCLADIYKLNSSASKYFINKHIRSHLFFNSFNYMCCEKCKINTRVQSNKLMKKLCYFCSSKLFLKELDFNYVPINQLSSVILCTTKTFKLTVQYTSILNVTAYTDFGGRCRPKRIFYTVAILERDRFDLLLASVKRKKIN
jgi:hypothetical protein